MHHQSPVLVFVGVWAAVALSLASVPVAAQDASPVVALSELSPVVDHPLVPLATVLTKVFIGEEIDPETGETLAIRVEETVLPDTGRVAGVEVTVVNVDDFHNGVFVKTTEDYFAQGSDGTVYYLGERVDEYENGQVIGHEGAWLAGEDGNQPGMFMLADPMVGEVFSQERVPGVAEERSTVIDVEQTVATPAGTFDGCVLTEDVDLPDGPTEHKSYCPGVGLVREDFPGGHIDLLQFETTVADDPI